MEFKASKICRLLSITILFFSIVINGNGKEKWDWRLTGPTGGDVRSMVIDPMDPERLYIGTIDGQIYTTVDGGKNWSYIKSFNQPGLFIDQILIDSRTSSTIYVAAHKHKEAGGFFKSTDSGITWRESPQLKTEGLHAIAQSPSKPDFLLAGTNRGIFRSNDSGETWSQIDTSSYPELTHVESLAIDPRNIETIYAGTWRQLWKTTDGGKIWTPTKKETIGDKDIFGINIDSSDPDCVLVAACNGVFETRSAGKTWRKLLGIPDEARRTPAALKHPTLPKIIFAGTTKGLWRSANGGTTWTVVTSNQLEINAIAIHPKKPEIVYLGTNNYGVMISRDNGRSFTESNDGFSSRRVYSIWPDNDKSGWFYAATTNTATGGGFLFISKDKGEKWQPIMQGIPTNIAINTILQDRKDGNLIYLGTNSGVYQSKDRGESWSPAIDMTTASPANLTLATESINALVPTHDEQNGRSGVFAATNSGLYKSYDVTKGWDRLFYGKGIDVRTLCVRVDRKDPSTIWVGTSISGVLVSKDKGQTWQQVKDISTSAPVNVIEQDQKMPERIYIGTAWSLYMSDNGGQSWMRRGGNLPLGNYTSVALNPVNSNEVLAGNAGDNGGVYQSVDAGKTWTRIDPQLPSKRIWSMTFDRSNNIFIGSHSAGVYVIKRD
jgi:photosystem II stability/assembly factor-like uncharacterized protein